MMNQAGRTFTVSDNFKKRADSAAFYEAWVGSVLTRAGLTVTLYPFAGGNEPDVGQHAHSWDLTVRFGSNGTRVPVEVKSVNLTFADCKSYPYSSVLVCSQNSFLRKWPGCDRVMRDFLFVSRETGSIVWLPEFSKVQLGHDVFDHTRNELYRAVRCDRDQLMELADFTHAVRGDVWPNR